MSTTSAIYDLPLRARSKGRAAVRDKEATIPAILTAAEAEFARYGLYGARVENIAKSAGVTKGLIFHYFHNKEHLFEAVLEQAGEPIRSVVEELESSMSSPKEMLSTLVESFLASMAARPLSHLLFTLESIQNQGEHRRKIKLPSLYRVLESILEAGMKDGSFCKLDTSHTAICIFGLCIYYYIGAQIHPDPSLRSDPYSKAALARHAQEVVRFVEARVSADQKFQTSYESDLASPLTDRIVNQGWDAMNRSLKNS